MKIGVRARSAVAAGVLCAVAELGGVLGVGAGGGGPFGCGSDGNAEDVAEDGGRHLGSQVQQRAVASAAGGEAVDGEASTELSGTAWASWPEAGEQPGVVGAPAERQGSFALLGEAEQECVQWRGNGDGGGQGQAGRRFRC